jgi:hypothetical protein
MVQNYIKEQLYFHAMNYREFQKRFPTENAAIVYIISDFSVLTGTIFEHTHLDLRMWLYAINAVIIARKGISAKQLQREF